MFNKKYESYKAIWSWNSFDVFDFKAFLMELPIVSKGTLFRLQKKFNRSFNDNLDSIYPKILDVLRQDVQKARALHLIECFVRLTNKCWEFNIHYISQVLLQKYLPCNFYYVVYNYV